MSDGRAVALSRVAVASLLFAVAAGFVLGGFALGASADAQPGTEPPAPKTAYVDFLTLLKEDRKLRGEQQRIDFELGKLMDELIAEYQPKIIAQQEQLKLNKPDTREYRVAMARLLDLQRKVTEEKLVLETSAQLDLRTAGIEAFKELRRIVGELAKAQGYTQVLNIVRNPEKVAEAQGDFQALLQQLVLSPVLIFDAAHDLTDKALAESKRQRGQSYRVEIYAVGADGAELKPLEQGEQNPDKVEYEIKLGESLQLKARVFNEEGKPVEGKEAAVQWKRLGIMTGTVQADGKYAAPEEMPKSDQVRVIAINSVDPSARDELVVRLLNKDGTRKAAEQPKDK